MHFNKLEMLRRINNNDEFLYEMFKVALTSFPELFDELNDIIKSGEFDKIFRKAHQLKGSALNMNFDLLAQIAKDIEFHCKNQDMNKVCECFNNLLKEWEIVKNILQEE